MWWLYIGGGIVSSFFIAMLLGAGIVSLVETLGYEVSVLVRLKLLLALSISIAVIATYLGVKQHYKTDIWTLDGDLLTRGKPFNLSVDLNTIDKLIVGLPKPEQRKNVLHFLMMPFNKLRRQAIASMINCTLILKINDNEYLLLYLFHLGGGLDLMNKIYEQASDKADFEYEFTAREMAQLKHCKKNNLTNMNDLKDRA